MKIYKLYFFGYQLVAKIRSFINYAWDLDAIFKYFYLEKLMLHKKLPVKYQVARKIQNLRFFIM